VAAAWVAAGFLLLGTTACSDPGSAPAGHPAGLEAGAGASPHDGDGDGDGGATGEVGGSGPCTFEEASPALLEGPHVASIAGQSYSSNPPSSGPHCPTWGYWSFYRPPLHLPRCNYIHNLEHGGVVISFREREPDAALLGWLDGLVPRLTEDPDCATPRVIITADPELDTPIAAATWGFTFKAHCGDQPTADALVDFVLRHWGTRGRAPEPFVCAEGAARGANL